MENKLVSTDRLDKLTRLTGYSNDEISLIKNTVAKNTSDAELAMFGHMAKSYNLDPFNKEIWCYKDSKQNLIIFAGRDGFLRIAQSNKLWNGLYSCEVREGEKYSQEFDGDKIKLNHIKGVEKGKIIGAYCFIKPKGCEIPTIEYVDFDTYNKGYNVWKSHPADMIKKVAEVKALKKAFGINGLYDENDFSVSGENVIPIDTEVQIDAGKYVQIENLLRNCSIGEDEICQIESELENGISTVRADELVYYLIDNQIPAIQGGRPSAKEIRKEVEKKVNNE